MPLIPNPVAFEGFITVATAISSRFPRPGETPTRSMASALGSIAERMSITDLSRIDKDPDPDLPAFLEAHFNPREVRETIKVNWNEIPIPGMSHKRLQYHLTENVPFTFDLHFDALQMTGSTAFRGQKEVTQARNFLQSLCYAKADAQTVQDGAPPRVLFFWPNFLSITCVVAQEDWAYTMFQSDGAPRRFTCSMHLREIRDVRLSSSDVLRRGGKRFIQLGNDDSIIKAG